MSSNAETEKDLFRDTPVRFLGYANEVGEAFRGIISNRAVNFTYGIASTYVAADAIHKATEAHSNSTENGRIKKTFLVFCDVLLWQAFASVIIPGLLINRVCYAARYCLRNVQTKRVDKQYLVSAIGLATIPFIVQPIDRTVDHAMDTAVRPHLQRFHFDPEDAPD
nr:PREDICTED: mitochondrial fission process protein 1 [Bemisia tabaci]